MSEITIETMINTHGNEVKESGIQSLSQWRKGDTLQTLIAKLENAIRKNPTHVNDRWILMESLCLLRQWDRALNILQTCIRMAPEIQSTAQAVGNLISAEKQREGVFAGQQRPLSLTAERCWMDQLARAMALNAIGDTDAADALRQEALSEIPEAAGQSNLGDCEWLVDSDTRLSGVFECFIGGSYRWLAFTDIASLELETPKRLLDLVWSPARLRLHLGIATAQETAVEPETLHIFVPSRYPARTDQQESDTVLLAQETIWRDVGETGVFASGQKTLMSDVGDWPLLDLRTLKMVSPDVC